MKPVDAFALFRESIHKDTMKIRSGQEAKHDLRNLVAAKMSRDGVLERGPRIKARRENSVLEKSWAEKDLAQTKSTHAD
jgi:hypothetical protein